MTERALSWLAALADAAAAEADAAAADIVDLDEVKTERMYATGGLAAGKRV